MSKLLQKEGEEMQILLFGYGNDVIVGYEQKPKILSIKKTA
jgi:hypothetical protein